MKVAYWPGCVSRGFTPELHGSMAKVAPLLDIELVELDRACCCGAGVIAEHNQELADTLNARTFALAQQVDGAELMMNICSTCQGAQSECQERLDANAEYRDARQRDARGRGPAATRRASTNKNFLWLLVEEIGLDELRSRVKRPLTDLQGRARSTAATSCARPTASASTTSTRATRYLQQVIEALGGTVIDYAGVAQVLRLPDHHDEQGGLAQAGRPPPRRRGRRRRRLPGHAVPAVPPQPRPPAAAGRARRSAASSTCRSCTSPSSSASPSGSSPRSWASSATSSSRRRVIDWTTSVVAGVEAAGLAAVAPTARR